jgi:hypothetical protein
MHQAAQQMSSRYITRCKASSLPHTCLLMGVRPLAPWPSQLCCSITSISRDHQYVASKLCRQYTESTSSQDRRSGSSSAVCCRAKAASTPAAATASTAPMQLEPRVAFLAQLLSNGVLLPVLGGWLLVTALSAVASRARQVGPDRGGVCEGRVWVGGWWGAVRWGMRCARRHIDGEGLTYSGNTRTSSLSRLYTAHCTLLQILTPCVC